MQILRGTISCNRCGCIALPDATRCPKCGALYERNGTPKPVVETVNYYPTPTIANANIQVIRAHYQLTCHHHGTIQVKASVIGTPVKCPFCE
jgi:hypothetical protein